MSQPKADPISFCGKSCQAEDFVRDSVGAPKSLGWSVPSLQAGEPGSGLTPAPSGPWKGAVVLHPRRLVCPDLGAPLVLSGVSSCQQQREGAHVFLRKTSRGCDTVGWDPLFLSPESSPSPVPWRGHR